MLKDVIVEIFLNPPLLSRLPREFWRYHSFHRPGARPLFKFSPSTRVPCGVLNDGRHRHCSSSAAMFCRPAFVKDAAAIMGDSERSFKITAPLSSFAFSLQAPFLLLYLAIALIAVRTPPFLCYPSFTSCPLTAIPSVPLRTVAVTAGHLTLSSYLYSLRSPLFLFPLCV